MQFLRLTRWCLPLGLAFFVPQHLIAQERPADVALRNDCRLAHQVLVHGQPANKYDWALQVIEACGTEGAAAIAHELRDLRALSQRTAQLDQLNESAHRLIDVALFEAAMEIAADAAAGEAARIHAVGLLTLQVSQTNLPYEALITDPMAGGEVIVGPVTSRGPSILRELPPSACQAAFDLLNRLAGTDANPKVRLAADQARYAVERQCCDPEPE
jgi:hypothetical protein